MAPAPSRGTGGTLPFLARGPHPRTRRRAHRPVGFFAIGVFALTTLNWSPATGITAAGPVLSIDVAADRHRISPDVYGMSFADPALAAELHLSLDRWGGNSVTRYNWQTGVQNTASDYYYENLLPDRSANTFIAADRASGASTYLTVNTLGMVAKPGSPTNHPFACGFKVSKYGPQQSTDPFDPDCGNGVRPDGSLVTGNDPTDTGVAVAPSFTGAWVTDLVSRYGRASAGGVRVYGLDNEPVLWSDTHRDVHPSPTTYDELRNKDQAVAAAVKAADSSALVAGPSDWGWPAYFDTRAPGDKAAHGNVDLAPWYLQQMKAYADAHGGQRILDVFDEHYYPQAAGVALSPTGSAATQALRLRSTRSLWDPSYRDESWIGQCCNGIVRLVPQMRDWVASSYPGTKIGIGEYNWGGLESMNGALAQADVLGVFAREQVDMAMLWDPPTSTQPGAYAFRMYRNYDGQGSAFGDTWVRSASADQAKLAVYGAQRSTDGALTVMVVNKTSNDLTSPLTLANSPAGRSAQAYRYSAASLGSVQRLPDQPVSASGFTASYPANSITLLVMPPGRSPVADFNGNGTTDVSIFRPSSGLWAVQGGSPELTSYGTGGDVPVPADYDGDTKADVAVFRPAGGAWFVHKSTGGDTSLGYGVSTALPVPADYDGDGKADVAVFRPSGGAWYMHLSTGADTAVAFGTNGDVPVPGDYDGDGKADPAVFRPSSGTWFVHKSSGGDMAMSWGAPGDVPVPGDYDGDGKADIAVFRPSGGGWHIHRSTAGDVGVGYGIATDVPVPGDYDGDGKADIAVFRPSGGGWYTRLSATGADTSVTYGTGGDIPMPLPAAVRKLFY